MPPWWSLFWDEKFTIKIRFEQAGRYIIRDICAHCSDKVFANIEALKCVNISSLLDVVWPRPNLNLYLKRHRTGMDQQHLMFTHLIRHSTRAYGLLLLIIIDSHPSLSLFCQVPMNRWSRWWKKENGEQIKSRENIKCR